jgi:NAD-dependent deacetylase
MENTYKQVAEIIRESNNIVFFGGAGVSTECGIPDFRSESGLYNQELKYDYKPETILSHSFFKERPEVFYEFLREKLMFDNIFPNKGHKALVELEKLGKLKAVITQNIDGLHQLAGSTEVLELHGSLSRYYCCNCSSDYSFSYIKSTKDVPRCDCGGIIRPDVVLYEEALNNDVVSESMKYISNADTLIVAGTSLAVYPSAGLLKHFKGNKIIFINKDKTRYDKIADIIINKPFAKTMLKVMVELGVWNIKSSWC